VEQPGAGRAAALRPARERGGLQLFIFCAPADVVAEYRHKPRRTPPTEIPAADNPRIIEGEYIVHDDSDNHPAVKR